MPDLISRFSPADVATASRAAMAKLLPDLPPATGERLKLQRVTQRHGTDTRVLIYHIWDRHQPQLLDYHHFSYGVIFDPVLRYHEHPLVLRFYANRHRLYDKRDAVIPALWSEMQLAEELLFGFQAAENRQMIGLFRHLHAKNLAELKEQIYQGFLELLPYWHPRYAAVIDSYGASLTAREVEDVIATRVKFQPVGSRSTVSRTEYCRHVPPRLRAEVLERDGRRCLKCGATADLHVDHIVPVSKGGLTVLDNLQTLCAAENLSKGNRDSTDYRLRYFPKTETPRTSV